MSESYTWLVTGTSRGIGLEIVRQLVSSPSNVVLASCRSPESATELHALQSCAKGKLHIVKLDVSSEESITAAAESVKSLISASGIDYIINNAAVNLKTEGKDSAFTFSAENFMRTMRSNVVGPAFIAQTFLPYLEKGKRKVILNTTSALASFGLDLGAKSASYSISKTALNMLTYKQAKERPDFIVFTIDPGWVKTDMGGKDAPTEPRESASNILGLVTSATSETSGKFFRHDGTELPW